MSSNIVIPQKPGAPRRIGKNSLWFLKGVDPNTVYPPEIAEECVHFVHTLRARTICNADYTYKTWVRLNKTVLGNVIGQTKVNKVKAALLKAGHIEVNDSYRAGHYSKGYRFSPLFLQLKDSNGWEARHVKSKRLLRAMVKSKAEVRQGVKTVIDRHIFKMLKKIKVDPAIWKIPHEDRDMAMIELLEHSQHRYTVCEYSRRHTLISNMFSPIRMYMRVDGQSLWNVDIANSQPLFLAMFAREYWLHSQILPRSSKYKETTPARENLYRNTGDKNTNTNTIVYVDEGFLENVIKGLFFRYSGDIENPPITYGGSFRETPKDLQEFLTICERGQFYEWLADQLGTTRNEVKQPALAALYDNTDKHPNKIYQVLRTHFPTLVNIMDEIKRLGDNSTLPHETYAVLSHYIQRTEAFFMYKRVLPRMMKESPKAFFTPIHDSVLLQRENVAQIRYILQDEFKRLGVAAQIKTEDCADPKTYKHKLFKWEVLAHLQTIREIENSLSLLPDSTHFLRTVLNSLIKQVGDFVMSKLTEEYIRRHPDMMAWVEEYAEFLAEHGYGDNSSLVDRYNLAITLEQSN